MRGTPNIPTQFLQALVECRKSVLTFWIVRCPVHEHANPPQTFRLLRARRERPRNRCAAAEQRDEVASPHSITSLARAPAMWPAIGSYPTALCANAG